MLTSKQRAVLRGMANSMDTIFQVGKGGISDTLVAQTDDALRARELIKLRVLENSGYTAREAAEQLASQGSGELYVVTCFSDRDKLLDLPAVKKEAL